MLNYTLAPNPVLSFLSVGSRYHRRSGGITTRISMDRPETKDIARFFDNVSITKHCWLWTSHKNQKGYGRFRLHGSRFLAHRFSYELFVGPIEPGKQILHRRECGNPACVNPNHLYMGTNADNVRDRELWGKGRGKGSVKTGEANGRVILFESDVLAIRKIHKDKRCGYEETAKSFDVASSTIGGIVRRHRWKHI